MKKSRLLMLAAAVALVATVPLAVGEGKVSPPQDAPALSIAEWVKGDPVKIEDGKGKNIYVVEFWATWCGPCRASIPHLTEMQKQYKDKNVVFVGVSAEEPDVVKKFVEKQGDKMSYTVAVDKNKETHKAYSKIVPIPGIPTAFVVNTEGKVIWSGHPMGELEDVLKQLTSDEKEKPAPAKANN